MKPHRMSMTHSLVLNYGLTKDMSCYKSRFADPAEILQYHSEDYIAFMSKISPAMLAGVEPLPSDGARFNFSEFDCPVFHGIFDFVRLVSGASIDAAKQLAVGTADIAINWSGGLHHARKAEASGFCYVNDIVLAILELLKVHARVVYIDVDVHHGDGVQEAFYDTDRVMTVSFHKFGDNFFPGTGDIDEVGDRRGKMYSVNVPLRDGIDDASYASVFNPIMQAVMDFYQPSAVVLQLGADSLRGDLLGCFNLSIPGHAACVEFMKKFNVPLLILGGGGYNIRNVARCWTYETAVCINRQSELDLDLPMSEYLEYYEPDFRLIPDPPFLYENQNSRQYLQAVTARLIDQLRDLQAAPSVQMQTLPPAYMIDDEDFDALTGLDGDGDGTPQPLSRPLDRRDLFEDDKDQAGEDSSSDIQPGVPTG